MALTPTQIKHITQRLTVKKEKYLAWLKEEHTIPAISFTTEEKLTKIKNQDYTIADASNAYGNWYHRINFGERLATVDSDYQPAVEELNKTYNDLIDNLILGNSEDALKAIADFANIIEPEEIKGN